MSTILWEALPQNIRSGAWSALEAKPVREGS
jgi:hypothetical protein